MFVRTYVRLAKKKRDKKIGMARVIWQKKT